MATYINDSCGEISSYCRPPTTMTTPSALTSTIANNTTMPIYSQVLEGLENVPIQTFTTINNMQKALDLHGSS